jgi:type IV pilus assembly protein PilW
MKKHPSNAAHAALGFSLIELMIALLIGTILVLGLVQVFAASRSAYQLSQGIARNQENARFAVDFLTRDLRMAGHAGCVNDQSLLSVSGATITGGNIRSLFLSNANRDANNVGVLPFPLRFDVSIQGFEANGTSPGDNSPIAATPTAGAAGDWTPALPAELSSLGPIAGSDIVVLRYLSAEESPITAFNPGSTPAITYPAASGALATGGSGLFAVADCRGASVFQASAAPTATGMNVSATGLNQSNLSFISTQDGAQAYKPGSAALFRAESVAYYIRMNDSPVPEPALYRARWVSAPGSSAPPNAIQEEMVDGIESMQLLFGLDLETDPTLPPRGYIATMSTADDIGGLANAGLWRRVGAVQVGLMVRNSGERAASLQTVDNRRALLEVTMPAPLDGNYRSTYETTVALRNRLFGN